MSVILRDYQQHDLDLVRNELRRHRSVLLVQPTGAGKGTLASYIVHSAAGRGKRILFLVNRRTLVLDMSKRLDKLGLDHGIIMGSHKRKREWLSVHIASIDTLVRRERHYPADLLILDEAHFCISDGWKKVLDKYPDSKVLGMTATPIRTDGRGLGEVFESLVMGPTVSNLISRGYLVPSRVFAPGGPDVSAVKTTKGDFDQKQLADVVDRPKLVGNIVLHWKQLASDRKTAVFGVDKKHAAHIMEEFRAAGEQWACVTDETPDSERETIWEDLDNGSLKGVSSVGVISYGWDHPIVSCVIQARPSQSVGLHLQQIGRGSRPAPGKQDLLVLDHAGNVHRHGFYDDDRDWSLKGIEYRFKDSEEEDVRCAVCPFCQAAFSPGPENCPYCHRELPKLRREIQHDEGSLEEVKRTRKAIAVAEWRAGMTHEKRHLHFLELARTAKARGYKCGWATIKYKAIYGQWPPDEWMKEAETLTGVKLENPSPEWESAVQTLLDSSVDFKPGGRYSHRK